MQRCDPLGMYRTHMVSMILECSSGELLTSAAFMHHNGKGPDALEHSAALKGLVSAWMVWAVKAADNVSWEWLGASL